MPQATAERVGRIIAEGDKLAKHLGVCLDEIRPGYARCAMTIRDDMTNSADVGHGGATFTLADTAFAYACNAQGHVALATQCSITYIAATHAGDVLSAEATEVSLKGRNGVCDVTVSNQNGDKVALFRGNSLRLDQPL